MEMTLVPDMVRGSMQPLEKALNNPALPREPMHVQSLLDGCSFVAYMLSETWRRDNEVMEGGVERRALEARLKASAGLFDDALSLLTRASVVVQDLASGTEISRLEDQRNQIQVMRSQIDEILRWLGVPLPPINPADIQSEGPFKTSEEVLAGM